jgi:hypothetical protein
MRVLVAAGAIALLLLAPGAWAVDTLGHATNGTFPTGGPTTTGFAGGPGGAPGGFGGGAPGNLGGTTPGRSAGGGMFGGNDASLTAAIAYAQQHGGGTIAVASQSGAASSLITSGANVVAIGGFSGRESKVSTAWLADAIASGKIRYVLTTGGDSMPNDDRTGADTVLAAVKDIGKEVSSVDGLYDMQGLAGALRSQ